MAKFTFWILFWVSLAAAAPGPNRDRIIDAFEVLGLDLNVASIRDVEKQSKKIARDGSRDKAELEDARRVALEYLQKNQSIAVEKSLKQPKKWNLATEFPSLFEDIVDSQYQPANLIQRRKILVNMLNHPTDTIRFLIYASDNRRRNSIFFNVANELIPHLERMILNFERFNGPAHQQFEAAVNQVLTKRSLRKGQFSRFVAWIGDLHAASERNYRLLLKLAQEERFKDGAQNILKSWALQFGVPGGVQEELLNSKLKYAAQTLALSRTPLTGPVEAELIRKVQSFENPSASLTISEIWLERGFHKDTVVEVLRTFRDQLPPTNNIAVRASNNLLKHEIDEQRDLAVLKEAIAHDNTGSLKAAIKSMAVSEKTRKLMTATLFPEDLPRQSRNLTEDFPNLFRNHLNPANQDNVRRVAKNILEHPQEGIHFLALDTQPGSDLRFSDDLHDMKISVLEELKTQFNFRDSTHSSARYDEFEELFVDAALDYKKYRDFQRYPLLAQLQGFRFQSEKTYQMLLDSIEKQDVSSLQTDEVKDTLVAWSRRYGVPTAFESALLKKDTDFFSSLLINSGSRLKEETKIALLEKLPHTHHPRSWILASESRLSTDPRDPFAHEVLEKIKTQRGFDDEVRAAAARSLDKYFTKAGLPRKRGIKDCLLFNLSDLK